MVKKNWMNQFYNDISSIAGFIYQKKKKQLLKQQL